ncbi:MAG: ABC transporter ATP-binding protein [SAR324 cluster bacterium]|nr:ABC transporter ATP-binding protein [SAR324 cluster bacterium]
MSRYRLLISLLWRHAPSYLLGGVMTGLTLWMTLSIPRFLQEAIDLLSAGSSAMEGEFLASIGWILAFACTIVFTRTLSRMAFYVPGRKVEFELKNRLLTHLTALQRDFFLANPTGSIISRINNDINGVRMMMGFGLLMMINSFATLSVAPLYMYQISPRLTLYVVLPIVGAFALLQFAIRRMRGFQLDQMDALQGLSDFTVESYNGIDVLKTYRAHRWAERKFGDLNERVRATALRMSIMRAFFMPILNHIVNGLKVMLVMAGGVMVIQGEMTIGAFMAYSLYLTMLVWPLMGMTFMMFVVQRGLTALISLEAIFSTTPGISPADPEAERALPEQLQSGLSVSNLTYAYPDERERPVLNGVNFKVRPGEIVGVFGPIGSGKTTLVNLLNRYLEPPAGTVFLDGIDTTAIGQHRLRASVVTVSQEPFLFSDTIRENIRFANAEAPREAVENAARAAALTEDLARMPSGLETMVGEKGITLSGGQKQRIALARSLLKPCDLLILDDVLSAVDHETERYLIGQIYGFQHARSLLIVSHRVSVLERAHRIVVLEQGRVALMGTHTELIAQQGAYRSAYLLQSEQALPGEGAAGVSIKPPAAP